MRKLVALTLKKQAKRMLRKHKVKVVVVTGSVGKTSTTQAVATVLSENFNVRKTLHNYNTDIGVPCSVFGRTFPVSVKNIFGWAWIIASNEVSILRRQDYNLLVLELGTDTPGEIKEFSWLNPDIAIVTAVAPEHMEYFKTIDAVAEEELSVAAFADKTIVNKSMVASKYLKFAKSDELFNYHRTDISHLGLDASDLQVVGEHSIDSVAAAIAVGRELGMNKRSLISGAKKIVAQNGRMNVLEGVDGSTLIDDTYNSSPEAVTAALDYVYESKYDQKIVLLGNMNELGESSAELHKKVGDYCRHDEIDLVVALGADSVSYTAASAKEKGCAVAIAENPYEAAGIIKRQLDRNKKSVVLLKGSQNGVFAEEATKLLLRNPDDVEFLVRQDKSWIKKKKLSFKRDVSQL
ncbi:MAG: UDP-N-acetylmuramoyl-tripeptide--D-alanyl-D-alanine ligase [Candidatus Saccharimonadales bacterium]|jgi:UDP-N-acetylmuramoyl-tripeptide--D-alanyl-D-alanine ligase